LPKKEPSISFAHSVHWSLSYSECPSFVRFGFSEGFALFKLFILYTSLADLSYRLINVMLKCPYLPTRVFPLQVDLRAADS
jgi:hypothetical protein